MNAQEIIALQITKTEKIRRLLALGHSRTEVAAMLGIGYGFVQNVYARIYGVQRPRTRATNVYDLTTFCFARSFGVEIEAFGVSRGDLAQALQAAGVPTENESYNHAARPHWKIVADGSIHGERAFELVSPVLQGETGLQELKKVCEVLSQLGARVNKTCGLHLHFGAVDFTMQTWKNLVYNYASLENTIDGWMPESRRGANNNYSGTLRTDSWKAKINNASTLQKLSSALMNRSRYYKLNLESYWRHKTVEFRQHSGTIEFEKIKSWIDFCSRLIDFSKQNRVTETNMESLTQFVPEPTMQYFRSRTLHFLNRTQRAA